MYTIKFCATLVYMHLMFQTFTVPSWSWSFRRVNPAANGLVWSSCRARVCSCHPRGLRWHYPVWRERGWFLLLPSIADLLRPFYPVSLNPVRVGGGRQISAGSMDCKQLGIHRDIYLKDLTYSEVHFYFYFEMIGSKYILRDQPDEVSPCAHAGFHPHPSHCTRWWLWRWRENGSCVHSCLWHQQTLNTQQTRQHDSNSVSLFSCFTTSNSMFKFAGKWFLLSSVSLLTVFVAQCHNPVHVVSIIHNVTREVFDIHTNIWSFFNLSWERTFEYMQIYSATFCIFSHVEKLL